VAPDEALAFPTSGPGIVVADGAVVCADGAPAPEACMACVKAGSRQTFGDVPACSAAPPVKFRLPFEARSAADGCVAISLRG